MDLQQLKTFQTVAKLLNFHQASRVLNYSQSAVSAQIRRLEADLNVRLFDRLGKGVRLTEAGQMLVKYSKKMLDIEKETVAKVSGWTEPAGAISIRMPQSIGTYLLPSVLLAFQKRYPKIGFDVQSCSYQTLIHELQTGIIDVAFLLADSIPFEALEAEVIRIEPLVIVASGKHRLADRASLNIRDFDGETVLLPKHDCSYKMMFEQMLAEEEVHSVVFMELNSIEAIKRCVIMGVGVTMIPMMSVAEEIERRQMTVLPWENGDLETAILMIRHKDKWISPTLQAFMETVRDVMGSYPDALG